MPAFNFWVAGALGVACVVLFLIERSGRHMTLELKFKGDIKRESLFLQQWGQSVCTPLAGWVAWCFAQPDPRPAARATLPVLLTTTCVAVVKRLCGRVRPNREGAGTFLGPTWRHSNHRESFPSSHSACAVALSLSLSALYPAGAPVWWTLAVVTSGLRYVLDAHFPSDVVGGALAGYALAHVALRGLAAAGA